MTGEKASTSKPSASDGEGTRCTRPRPRGAPSTLHILARGAQYATSLEDVKALVVKLVEVLRFVGPTESVQEHTAVSLGKALILVPKEAGTELWQNV